MVGEDQIELTFLYGAKPLTKQISKTNVIPYPHLKNLTSEVELVSTINEMAEKIQFHACQGHALFAGKLTRQIKEASRAGLTDKTQLTRWICLDFDGLPGFSPASAVRELEAVCTGISETSYIIQYSASSRLNSQELGLRCHIFFLLDEPISPLMLKSWLISANLRTKFAQFISLSPAGITLHYPLDPALAEQSRIIFISTPIFTPASLDPHPDDRLQFVEGKFSELNVANMEKDKPEFNALQEEILSQAKQLRKKAGLATKKFQTSFTDDFCKNPDICEVTGIKNDRGYVYLNLNNGDSWGYWYPENDPSILYNFKGEPNYPLEKIVPDYWNMYIASGTSIHHPSGPGTLYFAFQDDHSGKTHTCIYNSYTRQLDISAALSDTAARRWLASYKQNTKFFHVVTTFYNPKPKAVLGVDLRLRTINRYEPPELIPCDKPVKKVPPTIDTIIRHALNQADPLICREYEHFLNWLAYIYQFRERTGTAWLLHGTTGTGKGVIISNIIKPLVGVKNLSLINMKTMSDRFTDLSDNKIVMGLDEIKRDDFTKHPGLMNRLKNIITEEIITSRGFQNAPKEIINYCNWIITSNEQVPLELPANDRRFNVAFGQPEPLRTIFNNSEEQVHNAIENLVPMELPQFARFLLDRKVTRGMVSVAINNQAKRNMIAAGRTATQSFFDLILKGSITEFTEEYQRLSVKENATAAIMENITIIHHGTIEDFKKFYEKFLVQIPNGPIALTREQVSMLAKIMLGKKIPTTPQRYLSWLAQFGLTEITVPCSVRKKTIKGVYMACPKV